MPSIVFYSTPDNKAETGSEEDKKFLQKTLVKLVSRRYRSGQRIFIRCSDQTQMLELDEALWQLDADSFLAHSIDGEPSADKAPILIGTNNPENLNGFGCWVNLTESALVPIPRTEEIIEFVPSEEAQKAQARERYKIYCQNGVKPAFQEL
jgi:DNA polymerase-3 subunit chi